MNRLIRFAAALTLAAFAAGCSADSKRFTAIENTVAVITQAKVPPEVIVTAASAFDVIKVGATQYVRLPRCTGSNGPACRDPARMADLKKAVEEGTDARDKLKLFLRQYPGELGPKGLYDALVASTDVIANITAAYRSAANLTR